MSQFGKVLENRRNIVISRNTKINIDVSNIEIVSDISKINKYIESEEESFVIGGASIYKALMPKCNKMYITYIDEEFEGDTYFPKISKSEWKITYKKEGLRNEQNQYDYMYVNYERIKE